MAWVWVWYVSAWLEPMGTPQCVGRLVSPSPVFALTIISPLGSVNNLLLCVQGSDFKVGGSSWHDVSSDGRPLLPLCNWTLYTILKKVNIGTFQTSYQ